MQIKMHQSTRKGAKPTRNRKGKLASARLRQVKKTTKRTINNLKK